MMERQQDRPINMTAVLEALAPFVNDPRRAVIQAEASTSVVMVLLLLQLILGSFRRQTSSVLVKAGTWVTYTLSFPAIAYTLGMMQSSPVKNVLYPIWSLSLLLAAGCTNAINVYGLGENKEWKRNIIDYCQYVFYFIMISLLLEPRSLDLKENWNERYKNGFSLIPKSSDFESYKTPVLLLALLSLTIYHGAFYGRIGACRFIEYGHRHVRRVSKFMKNLPANDHGFDPVSMKGYRYPVHITVHAATDDEEAITIDQIWQCEGRLLRTSGSTDHGCNGLRDVCLAYAMYQLLKRRYYGMACAEEHLDETRDFVLKGLLRGTDDDYERAFRIVEVELGFCHDYFFTKHAIIFEHETRFFILFVMRTILTLMVAYVVWINTLSVKTLTSIIEVQSTRADDIITVLVLGTIVLIELLQAAFYMSSDWCKVSIACRYVTGSWYQGNAFFEKIMGCLTRFKIFGHWKNRIDQYSVLSKNRIDQYSVLSKLSAADTADERDLQAVKLAIVGTLRSCDGLPTNGEGLLRRNGVFAEFSWALQDQPQVEIMLVWHIATEHVNAISGKEEEPNFQRQVSVCLSRYCAYLMNSAPELLPGYFGDTKYAIRDVKEDARYQDGSQDQDEDDGIHMKGVKLGKLLEGMTCSIADRWKFLADFWTEKILYVAPSDDVKAHMERLANGGEFLTHIWALLTHAGIHKINGREDGRNTMPRQPSQASV